MDSKRFKVISVLLVLVLVILVILSIDVLKSNHNKKMVKVDIVKINNDYMGKALMLITGYNTNLSQDQKLAKAQVVMKIVGTSVENLLNDYSKKHNVLIVQSQAIASDSNAPLLDITQEIEKSINKTLDKNKLDEIAK